MDPAMVDRNRDYVDLDFDGPDWTPSAEDLRTLHRRYVADRIEAERVAARVEDVKARLRAWAQAIILAAFAARLYYLFC